MALHKIQGLHNNIIIKIVLVLIALTFIWSLGDFNSFTSTNYIAKVGNSTITAENYKKAHDNFMRHYGDSLQGLTNEQLENFGIKRLIINSLIQEKLKENLAQEMNINISDANVIKMIKLNSLFQTNQAFDLNKFKHYLNTNHLSEREFTTLFTDNISKSILFNNLVSSYVPNKALSEFLYDYYFETKFFDLYIISPLANARIKTSKEEIENFYAKHKENYQQAETREVKLIKIDHSELKINISDQEIDNFYNENIAQFSKPETRDFEAYIFNTQEEADAAKKSGKPDSERDGNIIKKDYKAVAQENLPEKVGQIIFSSKQGSLSEVFSQDGKFWIAKVTLINAPENTSLEQARKDIKQELTQIKKHSVTAEQVAKIEDEISGGSDIEEIAKAHHFKLSNIVISDDYKLVPQNILTTIMKSDNKDTEIAPFEDKLYIYKIEKINQAAPRNLSLIEEQVVADYKASQIENEINSFTKLLTTALETGDLKMELKGNDNFSITKKTNLQITRLNITEKNKIAGVPDEFVEKIAGSNQAIIEANIQRNIYIAKINHSEKPTKIDPDKLQFIQNNQTQNYDKAIEQEILLYLHKHYKVKIADNF